MAKRVDPRIGFQEESPMITGKGILQDDFSLGFADKYLKGTTQITNRNPNIIDPKNADKELSTSSFGDLPGEYVRESAGANKSILQGTVSGRVIGSQPIFAANMATPIGNATRREGALQAAAYKDASDREKVAAAKRKAGLPDYMKNAIQINDAEVNKLMHDQTKAQIDNVTKQAEFLYPDRFIEVLTAPKNTEEAKFRDELTSIIENMTAKNNSANRIITSLSDYDAKKGGLTYSPASRRQYQSLQSALADPNTTREQLLSAEVTFNGHKTVDEHIAAHKKGRVDQVITDYMTFNAKRFGKEGIINSSVKQIPPELRQPLFDEIYQELDLVGHGYSEEEAKQMINNSLDAHFQKSITNSFQKLETGDGYGKENENNVRFIKHNKPFNYTTPDGESTALKTVDGFKFDDVTIKGVSSENMFDMATGMPIEDKGAGKFSFSDVVTIPILNREFVFGETTLPVGSPVPDHMVSKLKKLGVIDYGMKVIGEHSVHNPEYPDNSGKEFITRKVIADADEYENIAVDKGVPFSHMVNTMNTLNHSDKVERAEKEIKKSDEKAFKSYTDTQKSSIKTFMDNNEGVSESDAFQILSDNNVEGF